MQLKVVAVTSPIHHATVRRKAIGFRIAHLLMLPPPQVSTRARVRLDAVSVHASPCRIQALQGVADRCAAAAREGAPPQALAWQRGECSGWVHVLHWGRGLGWRDATWQRRWLVRSPPLSVAQPLSALTVPLEARVE